MKILHISDTHGRHKELADLPQADMVIHSGDFSFGESEEEIISFLNWFLDLPYRHKILVAGNHDGVLYDARLEGLDANCHYLCNSGVEIDGFRFYGLPMFIQDYLNGRMEKNMENIPAGIDVLVSHQPPYGILDHSDSTNYGSHNLLARVGAIAPRLHLFGHIHASNGETMLGSTRFVNSAIASEDYLSLQPPHVLLIEPQRTR